MLAVARNRGLITGLWSTILTLNGTHYELKVYTFFHGYFKAQIMGQDAK